MKISRITQERKKELLSNGQYQDYSKKRRNAFLSGHPELIDKDDYFEMNKADIKDCEKIRRSKKEQRLKVQKHISYLMNRKDFDVYFCTFTFTDYALSLSAATRKQNVNRLLSKCDDYISNIDYGKKNGREHYHAVIGIKKGTYETSTNSEGYLTLNIFNGYKYGFTKVEECGRDDIDSKRLARYIDKLTSHSVKVSQQYISVKKGSDYQKYQKDQRTKKAIIKKSNYVRSDKLSFYDRWKDRPLQETFLEGNKGLKFEQNNLPLNIV